MMRNTTLAILVLLCAAGCSKPEPAAPPRTAAAESVRSAPSALVMERFNHSCALCHVTGAGGAPRVGHPDDWRTRLAQGREVLMQHTLEGFNDMPPLGYCMSCEVSDFHELIDFMTESH